MRLYLDACCYTRPFDDQSVPRNRMEAEAVLTILQRIQDGAWELVGSEALDLELDLIPTVEKRDYAQGLVVNAVAVDQSG